MILIRVCSHEQNQGFLQLFTVRSGFALKVGNSCPTNNPDFLRQSRPVPSVTSQFPFYSCHKSATTNLASYQRQKCGSHLDERSNPRGIHEYMAGRPCQSWII